MPEKTMDTLPRIGCDMLHFSRLLTDTAEGATYEESVHMPNVKSIGYNPNSSITTFFADDGPRVTYAQVGEEALSIERADLRPSDYALLTGAAFDKGLVSVGNPIPPAGAVMWRSQKSNGKYRYCRTLKTTFGVPAMNSKSKEQSPEFQTQSIEGKNALRQYDNIGFQFIDSDDPALDPSITEAVLIKEWFSDPNFDPTVAYTPGA